MVVKQYKYLNFLMVAFVGSYLTSEVVLNRLVSVWGGFITGGTFIYFLSPIIADVITEVYGYRVTRQVIWYGVFAWLFLGLGIHYCLKLPYPSFWAHSAAAYQAALGSLFRSCLVSSGAVLIGQLLNAYVLSKWKILSRGRYFWMRSMGSSVVGEGVTVILSIFGIFAGRIPPGTFSHTLIPELYIMLIFSAIGAIPASFLARYLKRAEGVDVYDVGVDFNPFKLAINDEKGGRS